MFTEPMRHPYRISRQVSAIYVWRCFAIVRCTMFHYRFLFDTVAAGVISSSSSKCSDSSPTDLLSSGDCLHVLRVWRSKLLASCGRTGVEPTSVPRMSLVGVRAAHAVRDTALAPAVQPRVLILVTLKYFSCSSLLQFYPAQATAARTFSSASKATGCSWERTCPHKISRHLGEEDVGVWHTS